MATWGEFIKEFKVVNLKAHGIQGMFVKVDDVLDLFDERQKLRTELAQAKEGTLADAQVAAERERCARDVEEFAEACASEEGQPEYIPTVLRYAAELIRNRGQAAPMAEAVEGEAIPPDEEAAALAAIEIPPPAEGIPTAEPVPPGEEHHS